MNYVQFSFMNQFNHPLSPFHSRVCKDDAPRVCLLLPVMKWWPSSQQKRQIRLMNSFNSSPPRLPYIVSQCTDSVVSRRPIKPSLIDPPHGTTRPASSQHNGVKLCQEDDLIFSLTPFAHVTSLPASSSVCLSLTANGDFGASLI